MACFGLTRRFIRLSISESSVLNFGTGKFWKTPIIAQQISALTPQTNGTEKRGCALRNYSSKAYKNQAPTKVIDFSYTGDKYQGPAPIDLTLPRLGYEEAIDLVDDPNLKRLFTLEFADEGERRDYRLRKIQEMIRRFPTDKDSPEERLTMMTLKMRAQMKHFKKVRKDKQAKHHVLCRSNRLRKLIVAVRQTDYERYTWLMREFGLEYMPKDRYPHIGKSRRAMRVKAARDHFRAVKKEKLEEVRARAAEERRKFDLVKEKELMEVKKELDALGVTLKVNLDDTLEELGVRRIQPRKMSGKKVRDRRLHNMMRKFGKLKQTAEIRDLPPELQEE